MRIAHVTAWFPPDSVGGTETYVAALARALQSAGHDVAVAAPRTGLSAALPEAVGGIPVVRFPIPTVPTRAEARGDVLARGAEHLVAWAQEWRPDVLHIHSISTGMQLPELRALKQSGARLVMTAHLPSLSFVCERGTLVEWGVRPCDGRREPTRCAACALQHRGVPRIVASAVARATPRRVARAARQWRGRWSTALALPSFVEDLAAKQRELFSLIDRLVLLNDPALRIVRLNGAPAEKLVLNRLGVSQAIQPKPGPDAAPTRRPVRVGFVGRFCYAKGIEDLLAAIERLDPQLPLTFEFRGPIVDDESRAIERAIRAIAKRRPAVSIAPPIAAEDVPRVLASFDILCAPSRWFENGPTIALEAMAAGTPVIGTRHGGFLDAIRDGENGCLVDVAAPQSLAAVLHDIAVDPSATIDKWRRHLPPARTMDDIVTDYLTLYDQVRDARLAVTA